MQHQTALVVLSPKHPRIQLALSSSENPRVVIQDKHIILQMTRRPDVVLLEVLVCYYSVMLTVTLETTQSIFITPRQHMSIQIQYQVQQSNTLTLEVERVHPAHTPIFSNLYPLFMEMDLEMELWYAKISDKQYSAFYQCKKTRQLYCCCVECPDTRQSFPTLREWAAHYAVQTTQPGRYVLAQCINGVICAHPSAQLQPYNPQLCMQSVGDIIKQHGYAWRSLGDKKYQKQFALQLQEKLQRLARI